MRFIRNLSIGRKLTIITVLTSGVALLIACGAFAIYEHQNFRRTMARDLATMTDIFDENVASGLAFNDVGSMEQTLHTLQGDPRIVAAAVYDRTGARVASYLREVRQPAFQFPVDPKAGQLFHPDRLDSFGSVELAGEVIGVVYLGSELNELREREWRYSMIVGILLVACSLLALALASRLQRLISGPIMSLARTADSIAVGQDYNRRAVKHGDDEVGHLVDGFNNMLAQIQARTQDLRREIAQRQASEETLAHERQLLRTLIDNLPVYLYVKNTAGQFVIGNLPHARLLGAESGVEVVGKTDFDLHPPEFAKRYGEDDQRVLRTGEALVQHEEPSNIRGQPGWLSTTKVPLSDRQGRITGLIGISQDISTRKTAESERDALQRQYAQTLRRAGMAEVATGVLHNVGNVLNSVNVSSSLVREALDSSEITSLTRVAGLLRERAGDIDAYLTADPKGRLIPRFVVELADQLAKEHNLLRVEHEHLARNIDHIKGIVAMQQNYARVSGVLEQVRVADLVGDALQMHAVSFAKHGVEVVRDYAELPPLILDKHKVMQILVNLVSNAKQALLEAGGSDRRITVRIGPGGAGRFQVAVTDNGVGISAENLTRVFAHGFTTRQDGHGFGLHSGANAAHEMGGSLRVESAGPGLGATFTLELPLAHTPPPP